ncbi:RNA-directed DNA polymerase [Dethiosulfatarculus sandiegensis]|uniref:RNA-directed DNA polymerase n=1 Tax=Dethiosulfatarculus sandiegensis TaxID=1429043 RepID=A0A0D2HR57_9BACT|nr:reverse transcriptase domain-containing protein [Dethiosulfatarculus sandiegensis]KIX12978.1 RNA-directed DNA polymerase [Dethiosulfatarculus sandiegensis]
MKSHKHLFEKITSFENLLEAARKAQKGKRFKPATARFNLDLEKNLLNIQAELHSGAYRHGSYQNFVIRDPKQRLISAAPYRDRVVHHALCNIIEPLFDKTFIHDSYACRKGKGTHAAMERYSRFARKNRFVLKCDIQKYFQSVDHEILLGMLSKKIRCPPTMALINEIIQSRVDNSIVQYFLGDDLFSPYQRLRGLPIGNLTSQFFGNLYLNGFDHFIKEQLRRHHYVRYVDDFVVFGNNSQELQGVSDCMVAYLSGLRLRLHPKKCRVYRTADGVSFLGFRIFPTHRLLDKGNALRMRRKLKRWQIMYADGDIDSEYIHPRIQSWVAHASYGNTHRLRKRLLEKTVFKRDEAENNVGRLVEQYGGERPLRQPQQQQPGQS